MGFGRAIVVALLSPRSDTQIVHEKKPIFVQSPLENDEHQFLKDAPAVSVLPSYAGTSRKQKPL